MVPKLLTLWPWLWLLTYFWKILILAFTFVPKEIGLSYYSWVFIVARTFCPYQHFLFCDLDLNFDLVLKKKLNLGINFWTEREGFHITHGYYLLQDLSVHTKIFDPMTLTNNFDLLLKKNLTLALTFEPKEIRVSYYTWIYLIARPFWVCQYQIFLSVTLTSNFDLLLKKLSFWTHWEYKILQKLGLGGGEKRPNIWLYNSLLKLRMVIWSDNNHSVDSCSVLKWIFKLSLLTWNM